MWDWLQDLDFGDGWGAVAFLIALGSGIAWWATRRKVDRIAEGFQTSMRELIEITRQNHASAHEPTTPAATPSPSSRAPATKREWLLENPSKYKFVLRNLGPGDVTGVTIDLERINCIVRTPPIGVSLAEGEGHALGLIGTFQTGGPPDQLWVMTDEEPDWVAVPVARWH